MYERMRAQLRQTHRIECCDLPRRAQSEDTSRKRHMSVHQAKPQHEIAYQDICSLLKKHAGIPPLEMLAVAANMLGKMIAMQDQRTVTPEMAMEVVAKNIESGNQQVLAELSQSRGSA
jgi:hypothetical protein